MTTQKETAPLGQGRPRNDVRCDGLNNCRDTKLPPFIQESQLCDVEAAIEASKECERILARKALMQRKATLDLIVYRDALEDLGTAVWRGAR